MATVREISSAIVNYVKARFQGDFVPLHRPVFEANERKYLVECIDSNFVSSVGSRVEEFENQVATFCGARYAVATVNGTAALHAGLIVCGVERGTEVLSQALTFVATANAISYIGAQPVFIDVDEDTLGMSPFALKIWLAQNVTIENGHPINIHTKARISACVPMHTFGLPARIQEIAAICREYNIPLFEDSAESLGSYVGSRHTGTFGVAAALSFNGNKIITTGGGGMIVTNDADLALRAKHITTTAKRPHPYEFFHDETGYNYRLPNLNAALGAAQMETLPETLKIKAELATEYGELCADLGVRYISGITDTCPNYWLNAILLENEDERDEVLEQLNSAGVMARPIWRLMTDLPMFRQSQNDGVKQSRMLSGRVINLPSSVPESEFHRLSR